MGAFEYTVLDVKGSELKGVLEGDTARQVRQQLREKGWTPLSVDEVVQKKSKGGLGLHLKRGVSATDLALIMRQLATLVRCLPLEEALQTVSQQTEKAHLKSMMMAVRSRVMEGHSLADGLSEFPQAFPDLFRTTVAAGERSGHLEVVLEQLADYAERQHDLKQKTQMALIYPSVLTIMAIVVVVFLLTYVVPEVVQVFDNIGQELPWLTRALISVSEFFQAYGFWMLVLLVLLIVAANRLMQHDDVKRRVHQFLLKLPLIKTLVQGANTARFARTFSILSASGVPVLEAMRISAKVLSNLPMKEAVEEGASRVREGASIRVALEKSGYFPPMMIHLIASGEASGNLDEMLERSATNQERELETTIAKLLGLFEPLLIVLMGAVVLTIVLAILLPIFDMNQLVK
ncbi:MAG: type II secretion system inner membrane protein GspF [Gammaproteobacteria bacterium]|nr:type II secretion system inner membrane protein GspF [Gammaproteobacteria bacterium]